MRFGALGRVAAAASVALVASSVLADTQTLTFVDSDDPGPGPCGIATARVGKTSFLLAGSHLDDRIQSFRIDRATGALTPAGEAVLAPGSRPAAIGFAWGRYAVVANQGSSDLHVLRLRSDGALSQVGDPVSTRGLAPADMVVSSAGLVAVTNNQSDELSTFWLDRGGRLRFLDKLATGRQPAGIALGKNRIAVANTGSQTVSLFRLRGKRHRMRFEIDNTTAILAAPLDVAFAGRDLYVATAPTEQDGPARLFRLRLQRDGSPSERGVVDAGRFLSGLHSDGRNVFGATVNAASQNELRVYDRRMNQRASLALASPPGSMTLAAQRRGRATHVFLNEFGNSSTSSFRLER